MLNRTSIESPDMDLIEVLGVATASRIPADRFHVGRVYSKWEPLPGRAVGTVVVRQCCRNPFLLERWVDVDEISRGLTALHRMRGMMAQPREEFLNELPSHLADMLAGRNFGDSFYYFDVLTSLARIDGSGGAAICAFEAGSMVESAARLLPAASVHAPESSRNLFTQPSKRLRFN